MEIRNADIKLENIYGFPPGALILRDKDVIFNCCNISGGVIVSYHPPRFRQCFLQDVIMDRSATGKEEGPIFLGCNLKNMRVPLESVFNDCGGEMPR